MRVLLDTHVLLWFYNGAPHLTNAALATINDPNQTKLVSPATYWEIAIKIALGKYVLSETYDEFIQHAILDNGFVILPIEPRHTSAVISLPPHHRDPFDRLLVAQAIVENTPLISADAVLDGYAITRVW